MVRAATTGAAQCMLTQTGTYMDTAACQAGSACGWKYKCNPDNSCTLSSTGTYSTSADCFGDAGKCGWKYKIVNGACTSASDGTYATAAECETALTALTTVTVPAGSGTVLRSQSAGSYPSGGVEYLFPIGAPFKAAKPFVQVRCGSTGTIFLSATNTDGTKSTGSDNAGARYELRGFGNVTANAADPDSSYPIIVWGAETNPYGGRNAGDVGYIPGFPSNNSNGNGRATVNKTYRMYIRVWDQTDDADIKLNWPTITITQSDNEGYTMTTVPNSSLGSYYPSAITSSDKTPCLNYNYTASNWKLAFNSELGVMYSPDGNYKVYKDQSTGQLKMYKKSTGETATVTGFTTTTDTIAVCMQTNGQLVAYNYNYSAKATQPSTAGTAAPYKLSLTNAGKLAVTDNTGAEKWSYTFVAPVV